MTAETSVRTQMVNTYTGNRLWIYGRKSLIRFKVLVGLLIVLKYQDQVLKGSNNFTKKFMAEMLKSRERA